MSLPPSHTGQLAHGAGGMDHTGGWKASQYTAQMGQAILARLREGETIRQVCADPEMPSMATLHRWRHMHPAFGAAYEQMRDESSEYRRMHGRLARERAVERRRIEHKIGRVRTRIERPGLRGSYDTAWAKAFCARVAKGQAVYRICAEPGMPSCKAVYGWLKRRPEFEAMYVAAKREGIAWLEFQAEMAAERALDDAITHGGFQAIKRKVAKIEGRIGRLRPKTYR